MNVMREVKKEKGKCVQPCPLFPKKMIGSCECRGCSNHKKHDRHNIEVICWVKEEK